MRYLLLAYVLVMAAVLTFKPAAAAKGPECGAGVLCIRTQKQVQAEVGRDVVPHLKGLSQ